MSTSVSTCKGCGAQIEFPYGQDTVKCEYCGLLNTKPVEPAEKSPRSADTGDQNAEGLIKRAYILLEESNFPHASQCIEQALNLDPEIASAYIAQLMIETGATIEGDLIRSVQPLCQYSSYKNAIRFASPEQKARLEKYNQLIQERINKENIEDRRRLHEEMLLNEQKAKKARKIWAIIGLITAAIIVIVSVSSAYAVPQSKYDQATRLAAQGDYVRAYRLFSEIINYKDAKEQLNRTADAAYESGDIYTAARAWRFTGNVEKMRMFDGLVAAGNFHFAGLKQDGTVLAAGNNEYGQCDVSGWTDITAVAAGSFHTVGLKSDGTVAAAGSNEYDQCNVFEWTDIVKISAGEKHTVALKSDGTVVAAGSNEYGQCNVSEWENIVDIAAGGSHTVGLKADGTMVAIGDNSAGQRDINGAEFKNNIVAVAAGKSNTICLKDYGQVVAAGSDADAIYLLDTQDAKFVAAAAGDDYGIVVNTNGMIDKSGSYNETIDDWSDIIAISARDNRIIGLKADGSVVGDENSPDELTGWNLFENKGGDAMPQTSPQATQLNAAVSDGNFAFTSDAVYAALSTDNETVKFETRNTFAYPEYTADWSHAGSLRLVCYADPASGKVRAITLVCKASSINSSHGDAFLNYLMQIVGLCNVPKDFSEISDELGLSYFTRGPNPVTIHSNGVGIDCTWNDEDAFFKIYPESSTLDIKSLPVKIDRPADFFSDDERREAYTELNESFQFSEILALANEYIAQNSPAETDSAYAIVEQAQAGMDAMENCTLVKDEFEGDVSIYYNGVEKLSSEVNFLPYIEDHDDTLLVGFTAQDWLFFNSLYIKADDEMVDQSHFKDTAMTQDVTDNGIYEDISIVLSLDDIDKILNSDKAAIRFENDESGKTRDHTITESEKNALRATSTIRTAYVALSNLCYHWVND